MSSGKEVFGCLLKDGSELAEVTTGGRLFRVSRSCNSECSVADGAYGSWYDEPLTGARS